MAVVSNGIEFALRTRRQRMNTDVHSLSCLRLICACASYLYRLFPKVFFRNIRRICVVALPKAYILVRFWQRVSAVPKHRYCLIPAASVPLLKILDVSEAAWTPLVPSCSKFFVRKTCRCTVYTDVRCTTCLRVFFIRS